MIASLRALAVCVVALLPAAASATPSTTFWAPSTAAIQPFGVMHVTYDTYFQRRATYPIDVGLEAGVLPGRRLQAELGFDVLYPTFSGGRGLDVPAFVNGKVGSPEDALFPGSPAWSAGVFGVGFERHVTDYDVVHAMLGRTFPHLGTVSLGGYFGLNGRLLRDAAGTVRRGGLMAGWSSPAFHLPALDHAQLAADVQTGHNALGAAGGGVAVYLTPAASLLIGPVYFLEPSLQPGGTRWMWSVQFDGDLDLLHHAR